MWDASLPVCPFPVAVRFTVRVNPTRENPPPVVLLHGFGDSPECWQPFLHAMPAELVVDIVTPAQPGHGGEPLEHGRALDLPTLVEHAAPHVERVVERAGRAAVVGGHSIGAATAVGLAAARPDLVAALYLEDPPWSAPPTGDRDPTAAAMTDQYREWILGLQSGSHRDRVEWCKGANPGWPDAEYDPWARSKAQVDPAVFDHPIDPFRFGWRSRVDQIDCPVFLIVGDPRSGSTCDAPVVDDLRARAHWQVTQVPGATHDVRRVARSAAIEVLSEAIRSAC